MGEKNVAPKRKRPLLIVGAGALATVVVVGVGVSFALSRGSGDQYSHLPIDSTPRVFPCTPPSDSRAITRMASVELSKNDSTGLTLAFNYDGLSRTLSTLEAELADFARAARSGLAQTPLTHSPSVGVELDYSRDPSTGDSSEPRDVLTVNVSPPTSEDEGFSYWVQGDGGDYFGPAHMDASGKVVAALPPGAVFGRPLGKRPQVKVTAREVYAGVNDSATLMHESVQECLEGTAPSGASGSRSTTTAGAQQSSTVPATGSSGKTPDSAENRLITLLDQHGVPTPDRLVAHLADNNAPTRYCDQLETGKGLPPENSAPERRANWLVGGLGQSVMYIYGSSNPEMVDHSKVTGILRDIASVYCPDQVPLIGGY